MKLIYKMAEDDDDTLIVRCQVCGDETRFHGGTPQWRVSTWKWQHRHETSLGEVSDK